MEYVHGPMDRVHGISLRVNGLIIKWEPLVGGSATRISSTEGVWSHLILIVDLQTDGPGGLFYTQPVKNRDQQGDSKAGGNGAHACGIAHQMLIHFFLRDLDYERESIYSLAAAKMIKIRLSMRRRLGHSSMAVRAASGDAPTLGMAPTAPVVQGAPPGEGSAWEALAQWLDSSSAAWQWWLGFGVSRRHRGGVYIGERCGVIRRDSKANFISNLIHFSTIIRSIWKGKEMSSLRSKILLWVGVLWPYGLGAGPVRNTGRGATRLQSVVDGDNR
jgi:hypothetical protein